MWEINTNYTKEEMSNYFDFLLQQRVDNLDWLLDVLTEISVLYVHFEDIENSNLFVHKIYKTVMIAIEDGANIKLV